jgi:hypothetical protein
VYGVYEYYEEGAEKTQGRLMKFKLRKQGIEFPYHGDTLVWVWPWKRKYLSRGKDAVYVSEKVRKTFPNLRDYWTHWGIQDEALRKEKMIGFTDLDVLFEWIGFKYPHQVVLVLRNINVQEKSKSFWEAVPARNRHMLSNDVCVLFFGDLHSASTVFASISPEFAEAYLFHGGHFHSINY